LSSAASKATAKWNSANYVQVKVSVRPAIAEAFKAACVATGVSMAGELSRFMAEYAAVTATNKVARKKAAEVDPVSTMKKRRETVRTVKDLLGLVKDAEETFIENAPENLQSAPIYETAEEYVSVLDNVIEQLGEIY
jgi:uncharacterized protein YhbP (UPF0306 family)